jgi:ankyrin repeat protein
MHCIKSTTMDYTLYTLLLLLVHTVPSPGFSRSAPVVLVCVTLRGEHSFMLACQNPTLAWVMNLQDNDGNTALHLAVKTGMLRSSSALLAATANRKVDLNITNAEGQTPLVIAHNNVLPGLIYFQVVFFLFTPF